jgi:hypothetical protein
VNRFIDSGNVVCGFVLHQPLVECVEVILSAQGINYLIGYGLPLLLNQVLQIGYHRIVEIVFSFEQLNNLFGGLSPNCQHFVLGPLEIPRVFSLLPLLNTELHSLGDFLGGFFWGFLGFLVLFLPLTKLGFQVQVRAKDSLGWVLCVTKLFGDLVWVLTEPPGNGGSPWVKVLFLCFWGLVVIRHGLFLQ